MVLDPGEVLAALGIPVKGAPPFGCKCPVCKRAGKFEVWTSESCRCLACGVRGHPLEIFALVRQVTLEVAVSELEEMYVLRRSKAEARDLVRRLNDEAEYKALHKTVSDRIQDEFPSTLRGILEPMGVSQDLAFARSRRHLGLFRGEDLEDHFPISKVMRPVLTWLGSYNALAAPAWSEGRLAGYQLWTPKGSAYLSLRHLPQPTIFDETGCLADRRTIICTDPQDALKMVLRGAVDSDASRRVISPVVYGGVSRQQPGKIIIWGPENDHLPLILGLQLEAEVVNRLKQPAEPKGGTSAAFDAVLERQAQPAEMVIADYLARRRLTEARQLVSQLCLTSVQAQKVAGAADMNVSQHVQAALAFADGSRAVVVEGKTVTETADGWYVGPRLISNAILRVTEVRTRDKAGFPLALGEVVFKGESRRFKVRLDTIINSPGRWLQQFVGKEFGGIATIAPNYSTRLLQVAQAFREPVAVTRPTLAGWYDDAFQFPLFSVDKAGIVSRSLPVDGPQIPPPSELLQQEMDAFECGSFCQLSLALLGNLLRVSQGLPALGLLTTSYSQLQSDLSHVLGLDVVPGSLEEAEAYANCPLPYLAHWQDRKPVLDRGLNTVLNVTPSTFTAAGIGGKWMRLNITPTAYTSQLRWVFTVLPLLLQAPPSASAPTFFREIVDRLPYRGRALRKASLDLDQDGGWYQGVAPRRMLDLVGWAVSAGLPLVETENGYRLDPRLYLQYLADAEITIPDLREQRQVLVSNKYVRLPSEGGWELDKGVWQLYRGLQPTGPG